MWNKRGLGSGAGEGSLEGWREEERTTVLQVAAARGWLTLPGRHAQGFDAHVHSWEDKHRVSRLTGTPGILHITRTLASSHSFTHIAGVILMLNATAACFAEITVALFEAPSTF